MILFGDFIALAMIPSVLFMYHGTRFAVDSIDDIY